MTPDLNLLRLGASPATATPGYLVAVIAVPSNLRLTSPNKEVKEKELVRAIEALQLPYLEETAHPIL